MQKPQVQFSALVHIGTKVESWAATRCPHNRLSSRLSAKARHRGHVAWPVWLTLYCLCCCLWLSFTRIDVRRTSAIEVAGDKQRAGLIILSLVSLADPF